MALFKIFRGAERELNSVSMHEGYAYFCTDTGNMFIDISNNPGDRIQLNAYAAKELIQYDINGNIAKEVDIDDLLLKNMVAEVQNGGTGANNLTVNALLIGNGTNPVKMVGIADGDLVLGDSTNGVKGVTIGDGELVIKDAANGITGIKGAGVLMALTAGAPTFGTVPIDVGGTGATDAASARTNLDVYSKSEVVKTTSSVCYTVTLYASGWTSNGNKYIYNYTNADLTAKVPPVITYTSNLDEYSEIEAAEATANVGIVFTSSIQPTSDIGIIITDIK